ncbi:MAG: hypothetical protein RBU21_05430, partial [FCB group bacterium]|nr:hypothetical protein [FCB group bacterium]
PGLDWATGNTREDGVFYRPTGDDFVDRNGDGIPEAGTPDDAVASTPDPDPLLSGVGTKHFDRIVELESVDIDAATSEDSIARLVLNGGIFPNYPEHDGIDNDGDNAILSNDGIDNDGDGLVDERDATEDLYDARPEGIDEGRWEYDADAEAANPLLYLRALNAPGSYGAEYLPYIFDNVATGTVDSTTVGNEGYTGSPTDPPEWKAFSERRWYTPDNVVVTLYAGPRAEGRVADRVTYSERDVINRAADDIRDATPFDRDDLNLPRPSFWPDNTMGVDFYRSIERKHPFYNGDLHGSSNRWQATDGSYDDWSPSTSMYIRSNVDGTEGQRFSDAAFNHAFSGSPLRMNLAQRYLETAIKLWAFEEAREGIRNRNYASPGDVANLVSFMDSRTPLAPADYANLNVPFDDVPINYAAPEDDSVQGVMLAQHPYDNMDNAVPPRNLADDDTAAVMSNAAMDPLILSVGTANFYSILPGPTNWPAWDGTAAAAPAAWAPVFLFPLDGDNVGNIALDPNSGVRYAQDVTSPYYLFTGPYSGAYPVNASFPEELRTQLGPRWPLQLRSVMYVSQNVPSPPANPGGFNPAGPHDFTNPAATALFEWDGGDGLENGDYDVYIMTADNLAPVRSADIASRTVAGDETTGRYLQPFGRELVNEAVDASSQDMAFDVEMFTDRNYTGAAGEPYGPNGRCWIDDPSGSRPNYPEIDPATGLNEFERIGVNAYNPQGDSFGMLPKRPDDDGIIYYGTIRVENNYLALLLRNWTANGKLARFSRVVLTPKPRTHGRLNINTVETALANFGATSGDHPFNPLIGTAGIFSHPDGTYIAEGSSIGPSVAEYANAGLISNKVVANRMRINTDLTNPLVRYHQDGRYYENPSDLLTPHVEEGYPDILTLLAPPLDPAAVFAETTGRYSRLANLITTRSDVFEITVTAQTGYLSSEDLNDDGRIDYRNDFIVTGEKKIRTVYER